MKNTKLFLLILFIITSTIAPAQIKLPSLVSDNMLLQRNKPVNVWGWAAKNEKITISFSGKEYTTAANADGKWSLTLPKQTAGGPYEMTLQASNTITLKNILFGDVWVCSGQSNMAYKVSQTANAKTEIDNAIDLRIRHFIVPNTMSSLPKDDTRGKWVECNPSTVSRMSAVAYFFARDIYRHTKVPIGIIESAWGGTAAEAWISPESMANDPEYGKQAAELKYSNMDSLQAKNFKAYTKWLAEVESADAGNLNGEYIWAKKSHPDWPQIQLPKPFEDANDQFKGRDGVTWVSKTIQLNASDITDTCLLSLGKIIDDDLVFINGVKVGATHDGKYITRKYFVNKNVLHEGENTIVIRVIDYGNMNYRAGFNGSADQFFIKTPAATYSLAGNWNFKTGLDTVFKTLHEKYINPERIPGVLYNGMIAPLANYTITGFVWYQGESNTSRAYQYRSLFPKLITDWRTLFNNPNLPFLFVQLPKMNGQPKIPGNSTWAELREAQTLTLKLPNTYMAMTMDLGEAKNIHPANKQDVGKRLALLALKHLYGNKSLVADGPFFEKVVFKNNNCVLYFKNAEKGLTTVPAGAPVTAFQVETAGSGKFEFATATIKGKNTVEIASPNGQPITAVRYAWADNPGDLTLVNSAGLLAYPFRTDNYKGATYDARYDGQSH